MTSVSILAPLVRAIEIAAEKSSFDPNLLQPSAHAPEPDSGSYNFSSQTLFYSHQDTLLSPQTVPSLPLQGIKEDISSPGFSFY